MPRNVNCIFNDRGAWCTNTNIRRAFYLFGARCCVKFDSMSAHCPYCKPVPKPNVTPTPWPKHTK